MIKIVNYLPLPIDDYVSTNNVKFYFDYQDGSYGYNTSSTRGADTFSPFKKTLNFGVIAAGVNTLSELRTCIDYKNIYFVYGGYTPNFSTPSIPNYQVNYINGIVYASNWSMKCYKAENIPAYSKLVATTSGAAGISIIGINNDCEILVCGFNSASITTNKKYSIVYIIFGGYGPNMGSPSVSGSTVNTIAATSYDNNSYCMRLYSALNVETGATITANANSAAGVTIIGVY